MNSIPPTPPVAPVSLWDYAQFAKASLRTGLALHGISQERLARALGYENADTVEAWLSPSRPNHVPLWLVMHPALPRDVRAFVLAEADRLAGEQTPGAAESPEAQSAIALRSCGQFIIAVSGAVTAERIGVEQAAQLLVVAEKTIDALAGLCGRLRQRVSTGRRPPVVAVAGGR